MYARLRRMRETDGFTLIELLVVMIIIGILAAIAIPAYLVQQEKAHDAAAKSDLRNVATEIETYASDRNGDYTTATAPNVDADGEKPPISNGDTVYVLAHTSSYFCLAASTTQGTDLPANSPLRPSITKVIYWWDSAAGGLQPASSSTVTSSNPYGFGCPTLSATNYAGLDLGGTPFTP